MSDDLGSPERHLIWVNASNDGEEVMDGEFSVDAASPMLALRELLLRWEEEEVLGGSRRHSSLHVTDRVEFVISLKPDH
ncbi:hypothetical protein QMT40_001436 [Parvibaculaceae bacterium PLY_AMNH_Bact1]|nr:hypothetical protein QMT40_001436 [Parvibaculaceae bacterium PLY_AMNH_Bact1]